MEMGSITQATEELNQASYVDPSNIQPSLYQDLQDADEIRLLHLHPGSNLEKIECTLMHGTFAEQPQYEALSYMWGLEEVHRTITINGIKFRVRENLWSALQHLRRRSEPRVLWVDAICIHQMNVHERNHQVAQMGRIYNAASRVVVWLGPSDPASNRFLGLLSREWSISVEADCSSAVVAEKNKDLAAILSVLSRPYWKRLWIIQEFLMARDFTVQCGNGEFRPSWIYWFIHQLPTTLKDFDEHKSVVLLRKRAGILRASERVVPVRLIRQRLFAVYGRSNNFSVNFGLTLFQLFSDHEDAECSDQRDKIYGLYSLAPACCKAANQIDYSMTWQAALSRLIRHQIISHSAPPKPLRDRSYWAHVVGCRSGRID